MRKLKSIELRPGDVSDIAFEEYCGSDNRFWVDAEGVYYVGESAGTAEKLGNLEDVQSYLMSFLWQLEVGDDIMDAIVVLLDDDIWKKVCGELMPCTNMELLARYCELVPGFEEVLFSKFSIYME